MKKKLFTLNLQLFGEGGGDGAGTGTAAATGSDAEGSNMGEETKATDARLQRGRKAASPLSNVVYGKQEEAQDANVQESSNTVDQTEVPTQTVDRRTEFEKLIKGDYKDEFAGRTQEIINQRFKETKNLQSTVKAIEPIVDILSKHYKVDPSDLEGLSKAIEADNTYFEEEATKKGLTSQQYKEVMKIEKENQQLKAASIEKKRQEDGEKLYAKLMKESEDLKKSFPSFDFNTEVENPEFRDLLDRKWSVEKAYKALHTDEILGGAMYQTAQAVKEQLTNSIQSRSNRPSENGISSQASATIKKDVSSLTKQDREEINRRVKRGAIVTF